MKLDKNLSDMLNLTPMPSATEIITIDGEVIDAYSNKIESDYDTARQNLLELLVTGQNALSTALEVAKQSEHPRAFEVVGNLMKQLADVNQQLMDIHQQKAKLDAPGKAEASKQVTNNNAIFVGSTSELSKMIKSMNKGD